ncbi:uncharacterized protein cubi_01508 [Cryptosporidium ubiquitum]|uniref:Signal peptide-containing protein n=1 Tax=Cryptosporidium ubiquitum TaxID=857276 RepID=A0A1J4MDV6_9CRYT|nr:uncharacterized protein cubi_01508 [Cryptosporidium ubiquitum]OII72175.1 hypothetical protein cubi_01508 [Cryptosporidium ubiquitum]
MISEYVKFLVLVNLLMLVVLQSQFGQIGCNFAKKKISQEFHINEENFENADTVTLPGANVKEGQVQVIDLKNLLEEIPGNEKKSTNEMVESEIDFTDGDYSLPTESDSDGRLTGMSRGRSRERRFKFRFGEKKLNNYVNSKPDFHKKSVDHIKEDEKEGSSGYEASIDSDSESEKSVNSAKSFQSKDSNDSDNETVFEESLSPMPIIPIEEMKSKNSLDQVIQLLHNQSNLEAMREVKKKKDLKKEKLENQEMVMDKLRSVIDSMQKKSNLKKDYVYGAVRDYNINDLIEQKNLQNYGYNDIMINEKEDEIKKSRIFGEKKTQNELKTASMARKFYSKPSSALASELLVYSPLSGSSQKKSGAGLKTNKNQISRQNKLTFQSAEEPIISPEGTRVRSPISFSAKSTSVFTSQKSPDGSDKFQSNQGDDFKLEESFKESQGSSKSDNIENDQSSEESLSTVPTQIQSTDHEENSENSPHPWDDQAQEEQESGEQNDELKKRSSGNPIAMLESELMKLQDMVSLNIKKPTNLNNFGRIKPKSFHSDGEYLVKTSSPENNFLTRGKVSVGRIRKTRESKQAETHSPENKSVSKPFVTVGRLKSPTRPTLIDKMRPVIEDDTSVYDYETAAAVFNLKSSKLAMEDQNARLQMENQLRNPLIIPEFVPSDLSKPNMKETYFLGDKTPPRNRPNGFKRGMMASMSWNMARNPLSEGVAPPIVRVQKVRGQTEKRVISRKV